MNFKEFPEKMIGEFKSITDLSLMRSTICTYVAMQYHACIMNNELGEIKADCY